MAASKVSLPPPNNEAKARWGRRLPRLWRLATSAQRVSTAGGGDARKTFGCCQLLSLSGRAAPTRIDAPWNEQPLKDQPKNMAVSSRFLLVASRDAEEKSRTGDGRQPAAKAGQADARRAAAAPSSRIPLSRLCAPPPFPPCSCPDRAASIPRWRLVHGPQTATDRNTRSSRDLSNNPC